MGWLCSGRFYKPQNRAMTHANMINNYFNPNSVYTEKDFQTLLPDEVSCLLAFTSLCRTGQSILSTEAGQSKPPWFLTLSEGFCCTPNDGQCMSLHALILLLNYVIQLFSFIKRSTSMNQIKKI
ncbi:hypothetical protein C1H46_040164 [Malus baccata]|uniref:Uncharacterized protein n=1 Tax=Malus baccata TaxID=106549 RepID=A0A540KJA1_MALBA|nr:hypothetical protein C1H46_040164 [Malus baccata]